MNKELETMDSIGFDGMKLIQGNGFRYGVDAVLLAAFTVGETGGRGMKRRRAPRILELGCGNGIVSLILSHKIPESTMLGLEIQIKEAERARRNARLNHLEERIQIRAIDVASIGETALPEKFNAVVTNPPYFRRGGAIPNDASAKYIARHETSADLDDFIRAAAVQLDREGELFMVHRPDRLVDICCSMRAQGMEPKELQMVMPFPETKPNILLIHGVKGANSELRVLPPIHVREKDGRYSDLIQRIYERNREDERESN
ncbi:MAG: methyltransferase [Mogibacterium sp.]|uniref:tRNA1(Val) (adenine(37)-N6)-methyltransferase n=1 Tax=Mogibacterium sp. TaxID=2049035 RepID=UPI001A483FA1|nr:methyltransferase [Mogibacterium sp.]MBL6469612.1 methyltransferase [Mogibacterium sp.]